MNESILLEKSERLRMPFITASLAVVAMSLGVIRFLLDGHFSDAVSVQVTSSLMFALSSYLFRTKLSGFGVHVFLVTGTISVLGMVVIDGGMGEHVMVWVPFIPFLVVLLSNYLISIVYTILILLGITYLSHNSVSFANFSLGLACVFSCGVGIFLEQMRLTYEQRISELGTIHPLSGLHTRVVFDILLARAVGRFIRDKEEYALVFIDVNGLKSVNDTFGHPAGDALLKEVGRRLKEKVRESESLFHISGDEFVVIVHGEPDLNALKTRLRQIAGTLIYMNFRIPLSISVGAAKGTDDSETTLLAADSDMYLDKRSPSVSM